MQLENKIVKNEKVKTYIDALEPNIEILANALRQLILETSSDLEEAYKWSMPCYLNKGLICYLQGFKNYIYLGFPKGKALQELDFQKLLSGFGKSVRHIKVSQLEEIKKVEFQDLIRKAMTLK